MKSVVSLVLLFSLVNLQSTVLSEKILAVAFVSSKSHKITYQPLIHELARRGHDVTVLTPIRSKENVTNVREILTIDFEEEAKDVFPNFFEMKVAGKTFNPFLMLDMFGQLCERTYDLPQVRGLMEEKFDLIIVQPLFNDCVMGFVHHFKTSFIFIVPFQAPSMFTTFTGLPALPSFVPNVFLPLTDKMNILERMKNFGANVVLGAMLEWYWRPAMENIYRAKLGDSSIPGISEISGNVSLILSNSHFSLSGPRPYFPQIVECGGMHCRPPKPLPNDLADFLNSSGEDGFIYFSMGSAIQAHMMPEKYRLMFVNTFAKLKQKVLWKWETGEMPDLPKNVKLGKWLPQQDILGHPKIRLFITHGGFGGTTEAAYHGVPLLGIPMFGDQELNLQQSEKTGYALRLAFDELSEETITKGINTILNDKKFHERARQLSNLFRDQVDQPLERAAYWTEYIMRHKGAAHMRSAAKDLNFFQFHTIDIIAVFVIILMMISFLVFITVRFVCRKICFRPKKQIKKKNTKKTN